MSIRIEIIDPTIKDEKMLVATARFLMEIAGHQMVPAPVEVKASVTTVEVIEKTKTKRNKKDKEVNKVAEMIGFDLGKPGEDRTIEVPVAPPYAHSVPPFESSQVPPPPPMEKVVKEHKELDIPMDEREQTSIEELNAIGSEIVKKHNGEAPPFTPPPPVKIDFNSLIAKITKLTDEKKLENVDVLRIVKSHGLDKTHFLSTNPHLVEVVSMDIDKFVEGK